MDEDFRHYLPTGTAIGMVQSGLTKLFTLTAIVGLAYLGTSIARKEPQAPEYIRPITNALPYFSPVTTPVYTDGPKFIDFSTNLVSP